MNNGLKKSDKPSSAMARPLALWRACGNVERCCAIVLVMWLLVVLAAPDHFMQWVLRLLLFFFAGWTFLRWCRIAMNNPSGSSATAW
jgi:hypothetical protein